MRSTLHKFVRTLAPEGDLDGGSEAPADDTTEDTPGGATDSDTEDADDKKDGDDDEDSDWDPERARRKIRKANAEAQALRERTKTAEAKAAAADQATQELDAAKARALKLEVGFDLGLTKRLALRLQGSTVEELTADAEELLKEISPRGRSGKPKDPLTPGNSNPPGGDSELSAEEIVKRATNR